MKNLVKWYEKGWLIALCFISLIFIPVGLFLMWRFKKWNNFWKISLSIIFGVIFLFVAFSIYLSGTDEFKEGYKQGINNSHSTSENSNEKTSDTSEPTSNESKESNQKSQTEETEKKEEETTSNSNASSNAAGSSSNSGNQTVTKSSSASSSSGSTGSTSSSSKSSPSGSTAKPNAELSESRTVYITPTGKKYHYANPCGSGTYKPIKLDEAIKLGYQPCEKCVLH